MSIFDLNIDIEPFLLKNSHNKKYILDNFKNRLLFEGNFNLKSRDKPR